MSESKRERKDPKGGAGWKEDSRKERIVLYYTQYVLLFTCFRRLLISHSENKLSNF